MNHEHITRSEHICAACVAFSRDSRVLPELTQFVTKHSGSSPLVSIVRHRCFWVYSSWFVDSPFGCHFQLHPEISLHRHAAIHLCSSHLNTLHSWNMFNHIWWEIASVHRKDALVKTIIWSKSSCAHLCQWDMGLYDMNCLGVSFDSILVACSTVTVRRHTHSGFYCLLARYHMAQNLRKPAFRASNTFWVNYDFVTSV